METEKKESRLEDVYIMALQMINEKSTNDKFDDFGNFIAKTLRELNSKYTQQCYAEILIQEVLQCAKLNKLSHDSKININ